MENAGASAAEIQIGAAPEGIGAPSVEESAAAVPLFGHDISIGGWSLGGAPQVTHINIVAATILQDLLA